MNYSIISKYRGHIMGVATLWIAILHASMWFPIEPINWIKLIGQGGVDIFLFLSAFGLYYSYQKDDDKLSFWKKRFIRIFPVFIPLALLRWYYNDYSLTNGLLMLTTLLFWVNGNRETWYISAIVPLYLITPFYLKHFKGKELKLTIISVILTFILSIFFFSGPYIVFFARVPVFFLGFYAGYMAYHQMPITKKHWILQMLAFIAGFGLLRWAFVYTNEDILWNYGLYWYPMLLAAWPFCLFIASIFNKMDQWQVPVITSCFKKIGIVTLEFYLLHDMMIKFFTNIMTISPMYAAYGIVLNIIVIFATYYCALYYHNAMNWLMKHVKKKMIIIVVIIMALGISSVSIYKLHDKTQMNQVKIPVNLEFEVTELKNSAELAEFITSNPEITFHTSRINGIPVLEAYKDDGIKKPLVFLLHGLNGYKESFGYLLSQFANNGFHVVAFDAAGHGTRNDGAHNFYDIVVQTATDCNTLLGYFAQNEFIDANNYGTVGFSMGGMSSYWLAAYAGAQPKIIAPIASTPDFLMIQDLYLTDTIVENGVGNTDANIHAAMLEVMNNNNPAYNIDNFANVYTLICHGRADELIPYAIDENFYNQLVEKGHSAQLNLYDNVGHVIPSDFVPVLISKFKEVLGVQ